MLHCKLSTFQKEYRSMGWNGKMEKGLKGHEKIPLRESFRVPTASPSEDWEKMSRGICEFIDRNSCLQSKGTQNLLP